MWLAVTCRTTSPSASGFMQRSVIRTCGLSVRAYFSVRESDRYGSNRRQAPACFTKKPLCPSHQSWSLASSAATSRMSARSRSSVCEAGSNIVVLSLRHWTGFGVRALGFWIGTLQAVRIGFADITTTPACGDGKTKTRHGSGGEKVAKSESIGRINALKSGFRARGSNLHALPLAGVCRSTPGKRRGVRAGSPALACRLLCW